jgi:hypothetical protein
MAQFMNHNVVDDAVGGLDDAAVENHQSIFMAGA